MRFGWVLALALAACSSVQVKSDWDPRGELRRPAHLGVAELDPRCRPGNVRLDDPLVHKRIQAAIRTALDARGYRQVTGGKTRLRGRLPRRDRPQARRADDLHGLRAVPRLGHGRHAHGRRRVRGGDSDDRRRQPRHEGRDLARNCTDSRLQDLRTPEEREKRVQEVVDEVLAKFPTRTVGTIRLTPRPAHSIIRRSKALLGGQSMKYLISLLRSRFYNRSGRCAR